MKKILSFSAPITKEFAITQKDFREVDGGYEVDQVIFSTAFNRNKYYFQVSQLMAYATKLEKLGTNFNHDLSLTNGQYIPAGKAGYTKLWSGFNNGELEIRGTFRFTDPRVIAVMDQINAPSIELLVDDENAIISQNGEYYPTFEWIGTAQLLGVLAGSGDARNISEFKEFDLNLNPITNMTEEQITQLLNEQKAQFDAQLEAVKKEFEIVRQSKSESGGEYTYTDENGNVYKTTYKEMYSAVTELIEKGTMSNDSILYKMLESKGIKFHTVDAETAQADSQELTVEPVADAPAVDESETDIQVDEPVEVTETDEALKTVENALEESIQTKAKVFSQVQGSESLVDQVDATDDVKVNSMSIRDQVREKLSHINL